MEKVIKVRGMHCKSCEILLSDVLSDIDGVSVISADHKKGAIIIRPNGVGESKIRAAIEKEGYKVESF